MVHVYVMMVSVYLAVLQRLTGVCVNNTTHCIHFLSFSVSNAQLNIYYLQKHLAGIKEALCLLNT